MAQSLQSKVQALSALLVVFTLLSIPLFFQVRADANHDKHILKQTWGHKFFNNVVKDAPENVEVEDAWGQYVREQGENCGTMCDPDADSDGDGMSNQDEIREGRNPGCPENANPPGYCEGLPPTPPTAGNETLPPLDEQLFSRSDVGPGFSAPFDVPLRSPNYDRWRVTWNLDGYQGVSREYSVAIEDEDGNTVFTESAQLDLLEGTDDGSGELAAGQVPPSGATYTIRVIADTAIQGQWDLEVRGLRSGALAA